ncbi:uncharacterized protein V6R79_016499 [Siganus canaliculatus]
MSLLPGAFCPNRGRPSLALKLHRKQEVNRLLQKQRSRLGFFQTKTTHHIQQMTLVLCSFIKTREITVSGVNTSQSKPVNKAYADTGVMLLLRKILYSFESKKTGSRSHGAFTQQREIWFGKTLRVLVSVSPGGGFSTEVSRKTKRSSGGFPVTSSQIHRI